MSTTGTSRRSRLLAWLRKPVTVDPRSQAWCSGCKTLGPVEDGAFCWNCGHLIPGLTPTPYEAKAAGKLDRWFRWLR